MLKLQPALRKADVIRRTKGELSTDNTVNFSQFSSLRSNLSFSDILKVKKINHIKYNFLFLEVGENTGCF